MLYYNLFIKFTFYTIFSIILLVINLKHLLIYLIKGYQKIPGSFHQSCRHIPTCSNYGMEAINEYGSLKGSFLTIKRIMKCNPWGTSGYDPVIKKGEKA